MTFSYAGRGHSGSSTPHRQSAPDGNSAPLRVSATGAQSLADPVGGGLPADKHLHVAAGPQGRQRDQGAGPMLLGVTVAALAVLGLFAWLYLAW
jgi:hypothetical protein